MAGFELTNGQQTAIKRLEMWWKLASSQQVFEIAGYAGTGKSTIVNEAMDRLRLSVTDDVKFVAFTGKAALVLNMKGIPAITLHKLMYDSVEQEVPMRDSLGNKKTDENGNTVYKTVSKFVKKQSLPATIKLIVADECSMISQELWDDLKSFGIPIIVLGDQGQLPPIYGKSPLLQNPDVILTEIRRQAQDDPIVYLSMLAREGKKIPYQRYGKKAIALRPDQVTDTMWSRSDINLVGTNRTRDDLNNYIRYEILKRKRNIPQKNDKLICRRNNWDNTVDGTPLINGLIGYCTNPVDLGELKSKTFKMDFKPDFMIDEYFANLDVNISLFEENDHKLKREIIQNKYEPGEKFEFAYGITTHLSQGSSWKKVIYLHEDYGDATFRKQLKYTAITRAEQLLIFAY